MIIQFIVPAIPIAQPRQRHRVIQQSGGRAFATNYTPKNDPVNAFKAAVQLAASNAYRGPPIEGPVEMDVVFVMPRPKSMIWKKRDMPRVPHTGKPDRDNMLKSLQDALEGLLFRNDSQIYDGRATKWIAAGDEQPHVELTVSSA